MCMKVREILEMLDVCDFSNPDKINSDDCYAVIVKPLRKSIGYTFSFNYGATKLVLSLDNENFVIKIPFRGEFKLDEYHEFINAQNEYNDWDYCQREIELREVACQLDRVFAKVLLPNIYIGTKNGHPIYIQKKIQFTLSDMVDTSEYEELRRRIPEHYTFESVLPDYVDSEVWTFYLEQQLGIRSADIFTRFLNNNRILDLHNGNLAIDNGRAITIDYGGYDS